MIFTGCKVSGTACGVRKEEQTMDDSRIIGLFFDRSETAISQLTEKYGKLCKRIAVNILNNQEDAEECLNDALLGVWNSIPPNRPESLISYVCRIVRNQALKRYEYNTAAKRNSHFDAALEELEDCIASPEAVEHEVEGRQLEADIDEFLGSLKKEDRIIFMRRYYFSDPYADIAALTGFSEKNVSVRLVRIRARLRSFLNHKGYTI